jgi:hypothetical protein
MSAPRAKPPASVLGQKFAEKFQRPAAPRRPGASTAEVTWTPAAGDEGPHDVSLVPGAHVRHTVLHMS